MEIFRYNLHMNLKEEKDMRGFICENCQKWVSTEKNTNTINRNHCPHCLWSKHVDSQISGDRMSSCKGRMKPIGLSIKNPRIDKWGVEVKGEIMIIHECTICRRVSLNRTHSEDSQNEIMNIFEEGKKIPLEKKKSLKTNEIEVLGEESREEVEKQIFGSNTPR